MATQTPLTEERFLEVLAEFSSQVATKTDLDAFRSQLADSVATKNDLKAFATKEDLRDLASKDDLMGLATKQDLQDEIDGLREEMHEMGTQISDNVIATLDEHYVSNVEHQTLEKRVDKISSAN